MFNQSKLHVCGGYFDTQRIIARALKLNFVNYKADLEWRVNPIDADNKALLPGSPPIPETDAI